MIERAKINIHLGDCMEAMAKMEDKQYDLAIVDPPYNIASRQKRGVGSRIDKTGKMNSWNHKTPTSEFQKTRLFGVQIIILVFLLLNIFAFGIKNRRLIILQALNTPG